MDKKKFPSIWKNANVSPLLKKGDASELNNYRPISLLSCVGKVMEKAVFKYTFNYIRDNNLIYNLQSGFMPGHCTTHQLVHLYHAFCDALDKKKKVRLVVGDISKAFDRVWHAGILHKLTNMGITGSLNDWYSNYLTDRKQRVVINGYSSEYGNIEAGVPQGSVLGPLLFLIFINDITEGLETKISLYADDSLIYMTSNSPITNKDALDRDLIRIECWAKQWLVTFSPEKTCDMTLSLRPTAIAPTPLVFSGTDLKSVTVHKHLGLTFSSDLKWKNHIDDICTRAERRLSQLHALRFKLNRKTLETLYMSYIRPIVEYSDVVFTNFSDGDNNRIEKIQKRAGKIVSGAVKGTSYETIITELGWESLEVGRERRKLILFSDIVHGHAPDYLQTDLPESVQTRTQNRYQLRNRTHLSQYSTRTETFRNSFFPSTANIWNSTDDSIRLIDDRNTLKSTLKRKPPHQSTYYYMYLRRTNIIMARIRMQCSELNQHLYQNHVADSPSCPCGVAETPEHFVFDCPIYTVAREDFTSKLLQLHLTPTLHTVLYGKSPSKDLPELIKAVETFLLSTKRFTILNTIL